jgi:uncharacterized protein (DUF58 family)
VKPRERKSSPIWILPNRNAIGLAAVMLGMWYAGITQSNGAAYLLCFVVGSVVAVSTLHSWANLKGLEIALDPIEPVFAGGELVVRAHLSTTRRREHFAISLGPKTRGRAAFFARVPRTGSVAGEVRVLAPRRGSFATLPLRIETRYPLGFFTARRNVRFAARHRVYPAPAGTLPLPVSYSPARTGREGGQVEGDDFGGVRAWRPGESQRHIDWKAAARGQPLLTKRWAGDMDAAVVLDWDLLPGLAPEARLSQLARWTVQAERGHAAYGLRLPGGVNIPAGRGEAHYHSCLRRIAEFPLEGGA